MSRQAFRLGRVHAMERAEDHTRKDSAYWEGVYFQENLELELEEENAPQDVIYLTAGKSECRLYDRDDHYYIMGVWCHPAARGKGHARMLLKKAQRLARQEGKYLTLCASAYGDADGPKSHALIAWYERCGFRNMTPDRDPHTQYIEMRWDPHHA